MTVSATTAIGGESRIPSYYRARYYNPTTGRFLSEDPLGLVGSGPNYYAYVGGDPIDFDDPLGLYDPNSWQQEASNDIWNTGNPIAVARARLMADEALAAAQEWARQHAPDSEHNGPADAFRHCFWSCTMSKYLGEDTAQTIGNEHEEAGDRNGQPLNEEQMDARIIESEDVCRMTRARTAGILAPTSSCTEACTD